MHKYSLIAFGKTASFAIKTTTMSIAKILEK